MRTVSHLRFRIRAVLAVLAAGAAAVPLWRRVRALERELTAQRAGSRLLDDVVHADHQARVALLERRLSSWAAAAAVPTDPTPKPQPAAPTACTYDPKEGGPR